MKHLLGTLLGAAIGFPVVLSATAAPPGPTTPAAPVPAEMDIEKAEKLIRDVHKADYARKKPAELVEFARTLLKEAGGTADDPGAKFVLYREARDLAARGGDVPLALEVVDATVKAFAVKPADLAYAALEAAEKARVAPGRAVAEAALDAADEGVRADDYPSADRLLKIAAGAAGRAVGAPGLGASVAARSKELEVIRKAFESTEADRKLLRANPADPGANARVGRFLCLVKGDWEAGPPVLAKGDDEKLKAAAEQELAKPEKGEDRVALADRWWDLSGGLQAGERAEARLRAYHWYLRAAAASTGLARTRLDQRLAEVEKAEPAVARAGGWRVIFRSADPTIWNTKTNRGPDQFALPLDRVSIGVRYLKLTETTRKNYVIIEMTRDRLAGESTQDGYGWNGTGKLGRKAHLLGIYDLAWKDNGVNTIGVSAPFAVDNCRGWGFGERVWYGDVQGYTWNGQPVDKLVFEIAVKTGSLSPEETKYLLKKKK